MKKLLLLLILTLFCSALHSQKKAPIKKPVTKAFVLAKADNVTFETIKNVLYVFAAKDTVVLKTLEANRISTDGKIIPFTSGGTKLYAISWIEKATTDTKLKKEEAITTLTEIVDFATKSKVLSNSQTTTEISEIVYLDKNQTVSETREKLRKEGMDFSLLPNGDIVLKNKGMESKMTYDAKEKKFIAKKK